MSTSYTINENGITRPMTAEEKTAQISRDNDWASKSADRKLAAIKEVRLRKLKETDWYSNSDVTMPDNIKTWRQSLRDIPQNNTTEEQYDLLLARVDGNLTNEIWSKPE